MERVGTPKGNSMTLLNRARRAGPRQVALALSGLLVLAMAAVSGTALASSAAPASGMTGMTGMDQLTSASNGHAQTGFTNGWYDGHTVRFYYTKNYFCANPPASKASSKCEAGSDYTQTPASTFDPLYVVVPLGFISDHMEVLYYLDTEAMQLCDETGIHMVRAGTAGTHPKFIAMIDELIRERIHPGTPRRAEGTLGAAPDECAQTCCMWKTAARP